MQELIREPINTNLLQRYIDEWLSHVNTTHNWKRLHQILSNLLTGVISATDTHIGSTNLTLTSNRLLSGDGNNFSIEDLGYFTVISNNDMIFGTSANFNTIGASYYINVTGDYILNLPSATNAPVGAPLLNQTFGVGDVEFANYGFPTSLSGMDNGKMLVYNSTINQFVTQSLGVVTNIYNSDGALSSNRQLTGDEHNLTFGLPDDDLNATSDIPIFTVNAGNIIFNAGAEIQLNTLEGESVLISTAGLGIFTDSIFFGGESLGLPANPTPQMFLVLDGAINTGNLSVSTVAEMQTALGLDAGALTTGQVAFGNATSDGITGEAALVWDALNDRLSIGISTGTGKLNFPDAGTTAADGIQFGTGLANLYRYTANQLVTDGSLIIGEKTSYLNGAGLAVRGNGGVGKVEVYRASDNTTGTYINSYKARGTQLVPVALNTNDEVGLSQYYAYDGTVYNRVGFHGFTTYDAITKQANYIIQPNTDGSGSFKLIPNASIISAPGSLTGSNNTSAFTIGQIWNTSGNPTLIKATVTNTASGPSALLMDLQVGLTSMFKVDKAGNVAYLRSTTIGSSASAFAMFPITTVNGTPDSTGTNFQLSSSTTTQSATAGAFSIFGSTFAQTSGNQYFNLITSSFGAAAGSASYRPFGLLYTINNSGAQSGTATGIFVNATETALNSMTHNLMDLQVGGFSQFKVSNVGFGTFSGGLTLSGTFQTLSSVANASFAVRHGNGFQNTTDYSLGGSAGIMGKIAIAGSASGTATANYSAASFIISTLTMNRNTSGTHPIFANAAIRPLTINSAAGTLTNAATVYIEGAATGTGIPTNNYALWVDSGASRFDGVVNLAAYTVGTLPTGTRGDKAYVTDALAPTYGAAAVGGGAVIIPVFHNGTTWITA